LLRVESANPGWCVHARDVASAQLRKGCCLGRKGMESRLAGWKRRLIVQTSVAAGRLQSSMIGR
jgi:hypothetical protein